MRSQLVLFVSLLLALVIAGVGLPPGVQVAADSADFEVWVIDQADTRADGGGTLYIYQGETVTGMKAAVARPEVIDLGGAAHDLCVSQTGTAPRRPHMVLFSAAHSHAIISYVATGHVLFLEARTRTPVACLDVGEQAHAAYPSPDQTYIVVANQNGKLLQRIRTNYTANTFTLESAATLNLATCTTPSGAPCESAALRADNAPICPIIDSSSRFTFVTLRGGGLFVVDSTATPMAIVAEYDRSTIHPNGCGGIEVAGKMYINAGGGTAANPYESDLYVFRLSGFSTRPSPPNTPAPTPVFSHDIRGEVDSHGAVLVKGRFLWLADRAANRIVVVDTETDTVVNEIVLAGWISKDPAPDLLDIAPNGEWVFITLRGPRPLTANVEGINNAVGSTPGLGVVSVSPAGRLGALQAVAPISRIVEDVERADPHGLAVRRK